MNTQVLPVNEESIVLAAKLLQQGELVALPALPPMPATVRLSKKFLKPKAARRITR